MAERFLSPVEAARVYDRIGRLQDTQGFYERRAVEELLRRGAFERAAAVVEVGCGTGRLAERLLARRLPRDARYLGVDVSPRMVALSRQRLAPWRERAEVRLSTGSARIEAPEGTFDRFLACYLLDLLSPAQIAAVLGEARRLLSADGRLCLVSLARGASGAARLVTAGWERVWRVRPSLVGGCRPIELLRYVGAGGWTVEEQLLVTSFGVPSEVLVARPS